MISNNMTVNGEIAATTNRDDLDLMLTTASRAQRKNVTNVLYHDDPALSKH